MRLLAVDQGSLSLGLAAFDERDPFDVRVLTPVHPSAPWLERMVSMGAQLADHLAGEWVPEVVAIEGVVFHVNARSALVMGQTRGYLMCLFRALYPGVRIMEINPSRVRSVIGAPSRRAGAKQKNRWAVEAFTGAQLASEDANDAVVIGWAAQQELRLEALGMKPKPEPRRRRAPRPRGDAALTLNLGSGRMPSG